MQTFILSITLLTALALLVRAEWPKPSPHHLVRIGLLVVIALALTGLLGLWDLPVATDVFMGVFAA